MTSLMIARGLVVAGLCAVGVASASSARGPAVQPVAQIAYSDSAFAALVSRLSEPGGFFDSDNLVSNEASYLHVLGRMRAIGTSGGAYLGVGPDQNFSYIVQVKPRIALLIDIRRDNLLQQLMYKAIFTHAPTRIEFLALLFGRRPPADVAAWSAAEPQKLIDWVAAAPLDSAVATAARQRVLETVRRFGVPLDARDTATVTRFHREFITAGPELRYTSLGRPPRPFYPSYAQLVLERDLEGRQASYLAREDDYRWLRDFQHRGLVVPVVGNLAGDKAMQEIARFLRERGDSVSAVYASNAEQYIMRDGLFAKWAENLIRLPRTSRSVIIRSYFGRQWNGPHPNAQPGHFSTQMLQRIDAFAREWERGAITDYWALVTLGVEEP